MKGFGSIIFAFSLLFSVVTNVQSGTLLMADYRKFKNNEDIGVLYLQGFLDGVGFANALLDTNKRPPVYCEPDKLALNVSNLKQIVDRHYEKYKSMYQKDLSKGLPFGAVALMALKDAFPCK
jgi:hypothetical protein